MPPNVTADSNARLNGTYDPLLNFSYYPSGSNFSTDFTAGNNYYGGVGGLAADANAYTANDYRTGPSTSWLQGDDFLGATNNNNNLSSNYLNPEPSTYLPNLSSVNLDQIKIVSAPAGKVIVTLLGRPDDGKCTQGIRFRTESQ